MGGRTPCITFLGRLVRHWLFWAVLALVATSAVWRHPPTVLEQRARLDALERAVQRSRALEARLAARRVLLEKALNDSLARAEQLRRDLRAARGCYEQGEVFRVINGWRQRARIQLRRSLVRSIRVTHRWTSFDVDGVPSYTHDIDLWVYNNTDGPNGPRARVTLYGDGQSRSCTVAYSLEGDLMPGQTKLFSETVRTPFLARFASVEEVD